MSEGAAPPPPPSAPEPAAPPPDPGPAAWPAHRVFRALRERALPPAEREALERVALERKLANREQLDRLHVRSLDDEDVDRRATHEGVLQAAADDEVARRGLGGPVEEPSGVRAFAGGWLAIGRNLGPVIGQLVISAVTLLVMLIALRVAQKLGGVVAVVLVGLLFVGRYFFRLVGGNIRFAADVGRGRAPRLGLAPATALKAVWVLWVTLHLVPRDVLRTLAGLAAPAGNGAQAALILAGALPWFVCFLALLYGLDRQLGPLRAIGALRRGLRGRASAVVVLLALTCVPLVGGARLTLDPDGNAKALGVLLLAATFIAAHLGLARVYGAASTLDARVMRRGGAGWRSLASEGEESLRVFLASLLLVLVAFSALGQHELEQRVALADVAPWLGAWAPAITRITLHVVPLLGALVLLAQDELVRRDVDGDDQGLILDAGPRWPGTRVPWSAVRGYRRRDEGLQLVVRGTPAVLGPLIPCDGPRLDDTARWLESKGVRGDG
jgi:hypothetical protein